MKKKRILPFILSALLMLGTVPAAAEEENTAAGTENQEENTDASASQGQETVPERDPNLPDSYYEPVATNSLEGWPEGPAVWADAAVVMDCDTGSILYSKNMDKQEYPASITKLMTILLAIENSDPQERVEFSEHAIWGIERDSSHIGIRIGEVLSMEDCLYGMMLESANEVCIAVAEHVAGSEEAFVQMMNDRAAQLGCTNTHFVTTNGLHDDNHYTTAHDMALIAQAVWQYDLFREVQSNLTYKIGWTNRTGEQRWLGQQHKMMLNSTQYYYPYCVGGKTGFTDQALNTLVSYAQKDGKTLICVDLRTNGWQNYYDSQSMFNYGFDQFHQVTVGAQAKAPGFSFLPDDQELGTGITVTVPNEVSADSLTLEGSLENGTLTRTVSYKGYTVGTQSLDVSENISALLESSPALMAKQPASVSRAVEAITRPAPDKTGFIDRVTEAFSSLPSWKYPLVILLAGIIIFYVIILIFHIRRKRRRRRRRRKKAASRRKQGQQRRRT